MENVQIYAQNSVLKLLPHDLQSLDSLRQETILGNYYWGKSGYGWYDNEIQNTLLAFDIYQRAGRTAGCEAKVATNQTLELTKTGSTPIYFTTYQSFLMLMPIFLVFCIGYIFHLTNWASTCFITTTTFAVHRANISGSIFGSCHIYLANICTMIVPIV